MSKDYGATPPPNRAFGQARAFGAPVEKKNLDNLSNKEIMDDQKKLLVDQDVVLDDIDNALDRIARVGQDIGQETDQSTQIIDEIGSKTDRMDTRIQLTTKRVDKVRIESSTKGMWLVICLLIVGLVVLMIIAFH